MTKREKRTSMKEKQGKGRTLYGDEEKENIMRKRQKLAGVTPMQEKGSPQPSAFQLLRTTLFRRLW